MVCFDSQECDGGILQPIAFVLPNMTEAQHELLKVNSEIAELAYITDKAKLQFVKNGGDKEEVTSA